MLTTLVALLLLAPQSEWKPSDPAVLCKDAKDKKLCAELLKIRDRDQEVRFRWIEGPQTEALAAETAKVDHQNLARIEAILAKHGWPGPTLAGKSASGSVWLVLQHADLATQKKYVDMMKKAVDAGELDAALYGTTIDRILVREGKPQLYGTQFREMDGVQVPDPIEDEANVDKRRAAMGMTPLAQYAKDLGEAYKKPAAISPVIAREWRGRVATARAAEYRVLIIGEGIQKIRSTPGNLGVQMLTRAESGVTEFVVVSYWTSRSAIRAFAGEDIEKARFDSRDREFLIDPDEHVRHYEVMLEEWAAKK